MPTAFSLPDFVNRWRGSTLTERSAAQSHFIELCQLLDQPTPAAADQSGAFYTFEKGVSKAGGGEGFADVWLRERFAWEYKGKRKNLGAAYDQLLRYKDDLENPPLLVVCDMNAFEVHTNFTNTPRTVHAFTLADLLRPDPLPSTGSPGMSALEVLRAVFADPGRLRPLRTTAQVTEDAAREFSKLADSLRLRGADPERAARFLMRLLFCLFAEDTGLLPTGLFTKLVEGTRTRPAEFGRRVGALFAAMANGGSFGVEDIAHFDGGLFAGADAEALDLTAPDLDVLLRASKLDWASIEPAIFGTLFERSLDPAKRAQLGAHYTSRDDILRIVEPVLMAPLRREWAEVQRQAGEIVAKRDAAPPGATRRRHEAALQKLLMDFSGRIAGVRVLDPACGSGNFLYVALKALMDLEKQVIGFAATNGAQPFFYQVDPKQLHGIEVNPYAHELAQIVVWIGYIQWLRDNGAGVPAEPILKPLHNILHMDAILGRDAAGQPVEPEWPAADVIVGNPPFLGGNRVRGELSDEYVESMFGLYDGRVPASADLVCYWFERARRLVVAGAVQRAGLLATNSIRGGANRKVLDAIKASGDIFMAWSDRDWVLDGAAVRVSMVCFDDGSETTRTLDGAVVPAINADLTGRLDLTRAKRLTENANICFYGSQQKGSFDIASPVAYQMLAHPNALGKRNSDVVKRAMNADQLLHRGNEGWVIDFGVNMPIEEAADYEAPFEFVKQVVYPERKDRREKRQTDFWWLHARPSPRFRAALLTQRRYCATPSVAKHRVFVWLDSSILADHQLVVFGRDDDYFFGVLHSKAHELWSLRLCTWLGVGNDPRYTPTTTFETFPFPWAPGQELAGDPRVLAVAAAAADLVAKRDAWLNPPGASEADLKARTLTNLYNQRPTWLALAHDRLDRAVLDAYGWPHDLADDDLLGRLLALNGERSRT